MIKNRRLREYMTLHLTVSFLFAKHAHGLSLMVRTSAANTSTTRRRELTTSSARTEQRIAVVGRQQRVERRVHEYASLIDRRRLAAFRFSLRLETARPRRRTLQLERNLEACRTRR